MSVVVWFLFPLLIKGLDLKSQFVLLVKSLCLAGYFRVDLLSYDKPFAVDSNN